MERLQRRDLHRLVGATEWLPGHRHAGQGTGRSHRRPIVGLAPAAWSSTTTTGCSTRPPTSARSAGSAGRRRASRLVEDPEKSAATFLVIDGGRTRRPATSPASRRATGSRCSAAAGNCVNTGGKVSTRREEMAVKAHPAVYDCLVVGIRTRSTASPSPPSSAPRGTVARARGAAGTSCASTCPATSCRVSLTVVPGPAQCHRGGAVPSRQEMALAHVAV